MSQFLNLINSVGDGDNLPLISSLTNQAQEKIKDLLGGSIENLKMNEGLNQVVSNTIEENAPVLSNSMSSISKIYRWRFVMIGFLIAWAVFIILSRLLIKDEETKKTIESTNTLFFGGTGIITFIFFIYIASIVLITFVPAVVSLTPKIENVLGITGKVISAFTQQK